MKPKALLLTHITMGYGSPEMLNLYKVLEKSGYDVVISDQEDARRDYYELPGLNRLFRRNMKALDESERDKHYNEIVAFGKKFQPDITISSFAPFICDPNFPLNIGKKRALYSAELFHEYQPGNIDYIISPNEKRLQKIKNAYNDAKAFLIYNTPLLSEAQETTKATFNKPEILNVFYQGQISEQSGVDVLIEALKFSNNAYLHLCGDVRDNHLKQAISDAQSSGKLTYYGFLPRWRLDELRSLCHIGFIGWREDITQDDAIKYCCPTKLYDYISALQPVVYLKNYTLDRWNKMFGFGYSTGSYDDPKRLAQLMDSLHANKDEYEKTQRRLQSLTSTYLNYEYQSSDFLKALNRDLNTPPVEHSFISG